MRPVSSTPTQDYANPPSVEGCFVHLNTTLPSRARRIIKSNKNSLLCYGSISLRVGFENIAYPFTVRPDRFRPPTGPSAVTEWAEARTRRGGGQAPPAA